MRSLALTSALLLLAACPAPIEPQSPPLDRFVSPTSAVHFAAPGTTEGVLYVASSNFERAFDSGAITAVPLDGVRGLDADGNPTVRLPPFPYEGAPVPDLTELGLVAENQVQVASLVSVMDGLVVGDQVRLFVPSRDENSPYRTVETAPGLPTFLQCGGGIVGRDCRQGALELVNVEGGSDGVPSAPGPVAARVLPATNVPAPGGCEAQPADPQRVWITHSEVVTTPQGTLTDPKSYVARLDPDATQVTKDAFIQVSGSADRGGTHAVARMGRYVVVTGRRFSYPQRTNEGNPGFLLKLIDTLAPKGPVVASAGVESGQFTLTTEARGVAYDAETRRLYVVVQGPSALLVFDVQGTDVNTPQCKDAPIPAFPTLKLVNFVPLPSGASELELISRGPGRAGLVAITCTAEEGLVVFYDDDVGQAVGQVSRVGQQPFDIAVSPRGPGARLFVPVFGDGRVAVIDVPNLDEPGKARLVAHLGRPQP